MEELELIENVDDLRLKCFEQANKQGLLIIIFLYEKYNHTKNIEYINIISELLQTELAFWGGNEFFLFELAKRIQREHPNSEKCLERLLYFSITPYLKHFATDYNFSLIAHQLKKINPYNEVLKKYYEKNK